MASSASIEQCNFTGGRDKCFAICLFCMVWASSMFFPFNHTVANDDDAIADPQPNVLNLLSTIFPFSSTLPLPEGRQSAHYDQGGKVHNYCWLRVDRGWTTGKGMRKSAPGPDTYAAIDLAVKMELLPDPTDNNAPDWITCEWVGTKHQKNMDGVPCEHALIPHLEPFVPTLEFTTLKEFQELVCKECFEGVVIIHSDGTRYKMRSDMAGECVWEQHYQKKGIDPGVTTIRPQVLTKDGLLTWKGEWVLNA